MSESQGKPDLVELSVLEAEGCPAEIRALGDYLWVFLGYVVGAPMTLHVPCVCETEPFGVLPACLHRQFNVVECQGYGVDTDIGGSVVWVGQCRECARVYWAVSSDPAIPSRILKFLNSGSEEAQICVSYS